jgi:hypothetical protein
MLLTPVVRGLGSRSAEVTKVSPPPYEIFVKGYPSPNYKIAFLKKIVTFLAKK